MSMVIVSFVGKTGWPNRHIYPRPGIDWVGTLEGLQAAIVVRPGVDALDALRAAYAGRPDDAYPLLIDVERMEASFVVWNAPLRLWQLKPGSPWYEEIFG